MNEWMIFSLPCSQQNTRLHAVIYGLASMWRILHCAWPSRPADVVFWLVQTSSSLLLLSAVMCLLHENRRRRVYAGLPLPVFAVDAQWWWLAWTLQHVEVLISTRVRCVDDQHPVCMLRCGNDVVPAQRADLPRAAGCPWDRILLRRDVTRGSLARGQLTCHYHTIQSRLPAPKLEQTSSPAVAENKSIVRCWPGWLCSMLTMAIPNVENLAVRVFTICFNVFARWRQRLWFKSWGVWGDRVGVGLRVVIPVPKGALPIPMFNFRHFVSDRQIATVYHADRGSNWVQCSNTTGKTTNDIRFFNCSL